MIRWMRNQCLPLNIGFCDCEKDWEKLMQKFKSTDSPFLEVGAQACTHYFDHENGDKSVIVTIDAKDFMGRKLWQVAGLLAHEATHVMQYAKMAMRERVGGVEFEAYVVHGVTQWMFELFATSKIKLRGKK